VVLVDNYLGRNVGFLTIGMPWYRYSMVISACRFQNDFGLIKRPFLLQIPNLFLQGFNLHEAFVHATNRTAKGSVLEAIINNIPMQYLNEVWEALAERLEGASLLDSRLV